MLWAVRVLSLVDPVYSSECLYSASLQEPLPYQWGKDCTVKERLPERSGPLGSALSTLSQYCLLWVLVSHLLLDFKLPRIKDWAISFSCLPNSSLPDLGSTQEMPVFCWRKPHPFTPEFCLSQGLWPTREGQEPEGSNRAYTQSLHVAIKRSPSLLPPGWAWFLGGESKVRILVPGTKPLQPLKG